MNNKKSIRFNSKFEKIADIESDTIYQGKAGMNNYLFIFENNEITSAKTHKIMWVFYFQND